jgi:hypothetical protein
MHSCYACRRKPFSTFVVIIIQDPGIHNLFSLTVRLISRRRQGFWQVCNPLFQKTFSGSLFFQFVSYSLVTICWGGLISRLVFPGRFKEVQPEYAGITAGPVRLKDPSTFWISHQLTIPDLLPSGNKSLAVPRSLQRPLSLWPPNTCQRHALSRRSVRSGSECWRRSCGLGRARDGCKLVAG